MSTKWKETERDKVYVVSTGAYSDWSVDGIFTTRELALEFMSWQPTVNWNDIQERSLNPGILERKQGLLPWYVFTYRNGDIKSCEPHDCWVGETDWDLRYRQIDLSNPQPHLGKQILFVRCWARDRDHAIKIAGDIRTQVIANNQWVENAA